MPKIFIGTDNGGTTCKIAAVRENGEAVTTKLLQRLHECRRTDRDAVIASWISAISEFLAENSLSWPEVQGVGLAIPGPYERYGVLGKAANLPPQVLQRMERPRRLQSRRSPAKPAMKYRWSSATMANAAASPKRGWRAAKFTRLGADAHAGVRPRRGVCRARTDCRSTATRSREWKPRHMPAPLHLLGVTGKPFRAVAVATGAVSKPTRPFGSAALLEEKLVKYPGPRVREIHGATSKEKALITPQPRPKQGDALALEIFDFQARAHGLSRRQSHARAGPENHHHRWRLDGHGSRPRRNFASAIWALFKKRALHLSLAVAARHLEDCPSRLSAKCRRPSARR